jgi:hypothetical protein
MIAKNRAAMALVIAMCALGAGMAYAQQPQPAQQPPQQDEGPILRPKTPPAKPAIPTLLVSCDLACNWTLDGTAKGHIDAGATVKAKVSAGQHTVEAETEDALDKAENEVTVKAAEKASLTIALQTVRDARLKAEKDAKDKAEADAKAKADAEAKAKAEADAKAKAEQDARDKAAQAARIKAAKDQADQDARDKAFIEARDKASREAQAKAEQNAHDKAIRDEWDKEQRDRARVERENANRVWTDPATGLMWTRKDNGYALRWQPAVEYCRSLQLAGYSDWRLPSIDELKKIYNPNAGVACGPAGKMSCQIKGGIRLTTGVVWSSSSGDEPQTMRGFIFRGQGEAKKHVMELDKRGTNYDRALCVRNSDQ